MTTSLLTREALSQRVQELLGEQDAVAVQAGRLTDFSWQTLCFRRYDVLHLEFLVDGARHRVALPYEEFFVDEGHVANSLEDICVKPTETIVVRRRHPGHQGPVLFQAQRGVIDGDHRRHQEGYRAGCVPLLRQPTGITQARREDGSFRAPGHNDAPDAGQGRAGRSHPWGMAGADAKPARRRGGPWHPALRYALCLAIPASGRTACSANHGASVDHP